MELFANSAGVCQNPECNRKLFIPQETGKPVNIGECAHIIAYSDQGPRANVKVLVDDRNALSNLILLCSICHKVIDSNPKDYPEPTLREWLGNHATRLQSVFDVPQVATRDALGKAIQSLLEANREVFLAYGPHNGEYKAVSESKRLWDKYVHDRIIPNNRRVAMILERNNTLLSDEERRILTRFKFHVEGFEYNHTSGDKNANVPLFPPEMSNILKEDG